MDVFVAAFEEDREIIEAQQRIWDLTPDTMQKLFLRQDRAPYMMRQLLQRHLDAESEIASRARL